MSDDNLMDHLLKINWRYRSPDILPMGYAGHPDLIEKLNLCKTWRYKYNDRPPANVKLANPSRFTPKGSLVPLHDETMVETIIEADRIISTQMCPLDINGIDLANKIYLSEVRGNQIES